MTDRPYLLAFAILTVAAGSAFAQVTSPAARPRIGGMTFGSVKSLDVGKNTFAITGARPGESERQVKMQDKALLLRMSSAKVSDLKVGDTISVSGVPLKLDAREIRMGDMPGPGMRPPATTPPPPPPVNPKRRPARPSLAGPQATVLGRVARVNPLVVSLPQGLTVDVKTGPLTRFTRASKITLAQIKPGEPVTIFGPNAPDGAIDAFRIQVGFDALPFARRH